MGECRHINTCRQWVDRSGFELCEGAMLNEFDQNSCWKYLDLHDSCVKDRHRPREWKKQLSGQQESIVRMEGKLKCPRCGWATYISIEASAPKWQYCPICGSKVKYKPAKGFENASNV